MIVIINSMLVSAGLILVPWGIGAGLVLLSLAFVVLRSRKHPSW